MEHRWSWREPVVCDVTICYQGQRFPRCKVRNVSLGGVLVETPIESLSSGAIVDLVFDVPDPDGRLLPTIVLHRTGRCAGLMFLEDNDDLESFIRNIKEAGG